MQLHFLMLVLVLASGLLLALDARDMVLLVLCISFVVAAELLNSVVETIVDMICPAYDARAKIAKDVAAGAVLVASANALITGVLIFFGSEPLRSAGRTYVDPLRRPDISVMLAVGVLVLAAAVIMTKLLTGRANSGLWRGGAVSGHAAIGFFLAMTIVFTAGDRLVGILALLMAALIAQSRIDSGIHTVRQVVLGAVIAVFLTSAVYWAMPQLRNYLLTRPGPRRVLAPGDWRKGSDRRICSLPRTPGGLLATTSRVSHHAGLSVMGSAAVQS